MFRDMVRFMDIDKAFQAVVNRALKARLSPHELREKAGIGRTPYWRATAPKGTMTAGGRIKILRELERVMDEIERERGK